MNRSEMNKKTQMFGAWSGLLYVLLLTIGWVLFAGFVPAHSPMASAEEIAAIYQQDSMKIRIGMVFIMFGAMMCIPFSAAIARILYRMEGGLGVLTGSQLLAGLANTLLTFYPPLWWIVASFRAERSAEIVQLLNDTGWIQLIGGLTPFLPMLVTVGVAALCDDSEKPELPRWLGYTSLWIFVLCLPGQLLFFFKTGPFAWNGLIAFWVPVTIFCSWFLIMFWVLRKSAQNWRD